MALDELRVFDVSHNEKLNGQIPGKGLGKLRELISLNMSKVCRDLDALRLQYNYHSVTVTTLHRHLQQNSFLGPIPPTIGRVTSLVALNLSHNKLNVLPPEVAGMNRLEELDLSHNQLVR